MKLIEKRKVSIDELFREQFGNTLDNAVSELSLVEVQKPDENYWISIDVDSDMARARTQIKTRTLKRWIAILLASGVGLTIQQIWVWAKEQFGK